MVWFLIWLLVAALSAAGCVHQILVNPQNSISAPFLAAVCAVSIIMAVYNVVYGVVMGSRKG